MSFFQNPSFYLQTAEADIVRFLTKAESEVAVIEQDFLKALSWVQSNASEIATFVAGLIGVAASVSGGQIPAALITAQTALNTGMQLVNSAVAAAQQNSGGTVNTQTLAALSAAYAQFKNAEASAATQAASATAPNT